LRRLAKDLKPVPLFRSASAEKIKLIKQQIVEDIIRRLNNYDLLKDLIVNCDIIVDHITHLLEVDEMENLMISSLPADAVMAVTKAVFEVYEENKADVKPEEDDSMARRRSDYLVKVLNIAARRIVAENISDTAGLFERLYENEIIEFDMLPEKLRFDIQSKKIAEYVMTEIDDYVEKALNAADEEEMKSHVAVFKRVIPQFIKLKEWDIIKRIMETLQTYALQNDGASQKSELLLNIPDNVFEGCEESLADEFIHADQNSRKKINEILIPMNSKCIDIVEVVFKKGNDPDVFKNAVELISGKGELARKWADKILEGQNQPISLMNIALLVITNAGHSEDVPLVKKYLKHSNSSIRAKALVAIAKINKKDADDMAVDALNDEEEKVRNQAANLIEHELFLSGNAANKLLKYLKEKLQNKTISAHDAGLIAGLLRTIGKFRDSVNKELMEDEIIGIASDLLHERKGLLKFIGTELSREHEEIICACVSVLGKIGGTKSKDYLKSYLNNKTTLSNAAQEALTEINKRSVSK
jgi:HEAT repeat protein